MSWVQAMKGQRSWREVIPDRKKRALRPKQTDRPPLPKLTAWERKRLAAADREAAHRPMGHALEEQPIRKRKYVRKEGLPTARKRAFIAEFFTNCHIDSTGPSTRGMMAFIDWKLLYRKHRIPPMNANFILREIGLRLVQKLGGLRVWQASPDSAALITKLYEAP